MRSAASCCQPLQESCVPRAARNGPVESAVPLMVPVVALICFSTAILAQRRFCYTLSSKAGQNDPKRRLTSDEKTVHFCQRGCRVGFACRCCWLSRWLFRATRGIVFLGGRGEGAARARTVSRRASGPLRRLPHADERERGAYCREGAARRAGGLQTAGADSELGRIRAANRRLGAFQRRAGHHVLDDWQESGRQAGGSADAAVSVFAGRCRGHTRVSAITEEVERLWAARPEAGALRAANLCGKVRLSR